MGQGYSLNALPPGPSALETSDLADLTFEKPLGGARLLRTVRALHQDGVVVAKVCQKNNPNESFKHYVKALKEERRSLRDIPNVLPYQRIRETATLGVLVRQFIHSSLYDRISIRPFLETIEKKWIAFQLLCAVRDCHARPVFHGDIKSENILVTSWGWVYLTDFASTYKPVYLPEDNPHDFGIYYDTSARRTCNLAPERFYAPGEKPPEPHSVQWNMDIFSVGCVIAELFMETPIFSLSQLFRYRKGDYDPAVSLLNKIDDEHVRALITSMIRLNPEERWHAQDYLDEHKGKAFPLYFYQHLHTLMQEITDPSSGRRPPLAPDANNGESDDRIDRVYHDFELLSVSLGYEPASSDLQAQQIRVRSDLFPLEVDLPNNRHTATDRFPKQADNGTFILLNVITASMRSTARASSKIRACELLLAFAERLPDEAKLDRILPYIMPLLTDDSNDMVLVAVLRTMTQLLALINVISPVNSVLFTQYIFPRLQTFVSSKGFRRHSIVRATYATCLASLADTASRFLDMIQALRADETLPLISRTPDDNPDENVHHRNIYDVTRSEILDQFEAQTKVFLTDRDTAVRRAFLSSVPSLCVFFGEARANDVILSHLNTYLNDNDWRLKCSFFRTIVGVSVYMGGASLEDFILPLMLQALNDPQESVVEQALRSLASMAEMGLLQRARTWELIDALARFELHPNLWIREAASHFVTAATTYLSLADIRILVGPLINPYLKISISELNASELLDALKKPLPRAVLDLAVQWASKVEKSAFWKQIRDSPLAVIGRPGALPSMLSTQHSEPKHLSKISKTDEDEQWLGRLRNAGMRSEDEMKILAFREYLWRTGQKLKKDDPPSTHAVYEQIIALTKLKITPQTVIFNDSVRPPTEQLRILDEAIQEAAQDEQTEGSEPDASHTGDHLKVGKTTVHELRKKPSASGVSLSSSPSSGIGLLGRENDGARGAGGGLSSLEEFRKKALPDVATDGSLAAGKLHTPRSGSRGASNEPHSGSRAKDVAKFDRRAIHNYAGNDPAILKLLDSVYVDAFPVNIAEFGPFVQPLKRGGLRSSSHLSATDTWRPQGHLVGVLGEHSAKVNRIAVSPDHVFIATASDDGTVKIWDSSRFERNVTHRSRATYHFGGDARVTDLCFIESTYTLIAAGSDGCVRAVKIDVWTSQNGPSFKIGKTLRDWQIPPNDTRGPEFAVCCLHFRGESASTLLLATNKARILGVDIRDMSILFEFHNSAQHGMPISMCVGQRLDWLLVGTAHGILDLWDLRFKLRLRSWTFQNAVPITRLQLYPSRKGARRHKVVITGGTATGEVSVWDIEKVICHEVYRPSGSQVTKPINPKQYELINVDDDRSEGLLSRVAGSIAADTPTTGSPVNTQGHGAVSICAISHQSDSLDDDQTFIVEGGSDAKVRFWDRENLEGCRILSGAGTQTPPTYALGSIGLDTRVVIEKWPKSSAEDSNVMEAPQAAGRRSLNRPDSAGGRTARYDAIRLSSQHLIEGHLDVITDVAVLERPFGIVLSADRSGQVLAYR